MNQQNFAVTAYQHLKVLVVFNILLRKISLQVFSCKVTRITVQKRTTITRLVWTLAHILRIVYKLKACELTLKTIKSRLLKNLQSCRLKTSALVVSFLFLLFFRHYQQLSQSILSQQQTNIGPLPSITAITLIQVFLPFNLQYKFF